MNLVSDYERIILDPVVVEQTIVMILKRHSDRVSALGLSEIETKLVCCLSADSPPISLRMVASNPTGMGKRRVTSGGGDAHVPKRRLSSCTWARPVEARYDRCSRRRR